MTGLMNKCGFAKLAELLQKLIDVTILNSPIDYTAKFDLIIASLQAIDANTDGLEASLNSIDTSNTAIQTNTANAVTELQNVLTQVTAINANTDDVEDLLKDILEELKNPTNSPLHATKLDTVCAVIGGSGDPEPVTPLGWYDETGKHIKNSFSDANLKPYDESDVEIVDDCECKCKECP